MARTKRHWRGPLKELRRAVSYQKDAPLRMPLSKRFEMFRRGFRSASYALYSFDHNDPDDYLPDSAFREATLINGPFCRRILHDKLLFWRVFGDAFEGTFEMPRVVALIERGQLFPLPGGPAELRSVGALLEFCRRGTGVVLKPTDGWQGQGIASLTVADGTPYLNGQPVSPETVATHVAGRDRTLVTERVVQTGYAAAIFPEAANSIRVTTMQDPDDGHRPFVAVAVHRFGSNTTRPTDNVSRGGLMAPIDLQTGELGLAVKFPRETGGELFWCSHHPDTAAPIKGVKVPGWGTLQDQLLEVAARFPFLRYVGWDVLISGGTWWILEANHNPSPAVQMFHPYLKDPKVRRFFAHYGVV
ncbi:sugar-transfer associated ATP-grasp domain-containing protein [Truepera radiovictrix]|uniref:Alpha-L-glutamate ligase-related protein ATP-grasp domain-containing protein n=1 Tax=Truepera radiovictrix (strain DSM 17093 / CIP 108686 / LMG 22925 / RQ-24) TaxID=649638 RepID=D7CSY2_TRURR|nr:sugar-transfer associated ATP-grasp domain-containing protein [Truepera radiovictrix]ADI13749.1 hypothetical protein Trad_0613 [Truepera radiovictrix DSM 17093]WMT57686.1 sugar-transfer associated ATP-grasp domain-containing protein [Truepera radiovictrix]